MRNRQTSPWATQGQVAGGSVLRGALERDGREMSTSAVEADSEMERDSGLTADESLRRGARRAPRATAGGVQSAAPALQDDDDGRPRRVWQRRVGCEPGGRCTRSSRAPVPAAWRRDGTEQ